LSRRQEVNVRTARGGDRRPRISRLRGGPTTRRLFLTGNETRADRDFRAPREQNKERRSRG
jgi:hypothetical protein